MVRSARAVLAALVVLSVLGVAGPASATPVCTDGYMGGPPLAACGNRIFPEASTMIDYVQYLPDPATGFREFQYGIEFMAQKYPRWVSVFHLRDYYDDDDAVSAGPDRIRAHQPNDTGDGYDIWVIKLTDHNVPDEGKETLFYSLSVHGDEIGGREGGLRAIEDLAMAAENGGTISDGVEGYESTTGEQPEIHSYEVEDVLAKQAVYFVDFNIDGWTRGDHFRPDGSVNTGLYTRQNWMNTDLNRQMPTVGYIQASRNPLWETEMFYGHKLMHEVADAGVGGRMAYGADIHGESASRAWVDIMYPAGQFDSVKHRRLMAIAERTKSVIDETLFLGAVDAIEENTGGDAGEGIEDYDVNVPGIDNPAPVGPDVEGRTVSPQENNYPTKPARWGTVWDTLGYTDTGFLGDYMATELGVTGMDYEIFHNHADSGRPHGRPKSYILQENYINASRAIIKTAMAYAMTEREDFADFQIDPGGRVGYVYNPVPVTDTDANGAGRPPGPSSTPGIGQNGVPIEQRPYSATNMQFFADEDPYIVGGFNKAFPSAIAASDGYLDQFDTLVIADIALPEDPVGQSVDPAAYYANLREWVESGGNLVLTDRALHALGDMNVVPADQIQDITVYQPYMNPLVLDHPLLAGLRGNARQLSEATLIGYGIGDDASPMTIVTRSAWEAAGGVTVATTGDNDGESDDRTQTSVGELPLGSGVIRIMGGGLHMPTEENDHRYGLKDYSLTYSGLFILENSIVHDSEQLGTVSAELPAQAPEGLLLMTLLPVGAFASRRLRRHRQG